MIEFSKNKTITKRVTGLGKEVAVQILNLATSALGLVAALAWNDAVQSVFKEYFPSASGIAAKFFYAIMVSFLIVAVTINLTKIARITKKD